MRTSVGLVVYFGGSSYTKDSKSISRDTYLLTAEPVCLLREHPLFNYAERHESNYAFPYLGIIAQEGKKTPPLVFHSKHSLSQKHCILVVITSKRQVSFLMLLAMQRWFHDAALKAARFNKRDS